MKIKRIGILTSGGDCGGLNAVVRAVTYRAIEKYGWEVFGIRDGTTGLMQRPLQYEKLTLKRFTGNLIRQGGTFLGTTSSGNPFRFKMENGKYEDKSQDIINGYKKLRLDAFIGIGGDGSMKILKKLSDQGGLNFVGIPKTIDNDVNSTEISVGYDTAVEVATSALDMLQPTAASHKRLMVLEVMGRDAGHIALNAGIAGGADIILIPEINYNLIKIAKHIKEIRQQGRNHALMVVAEAVKKEDGTKATVKHTGGQIRLGGIGSYLAHKISQLTDTETRVTVLGHVQRGSQPSSRDRLVGSAFGVHAVDMIANNKFNRIAVWQNRGVTDVSLHEIINKSRKVNPNGRLVRTARGLGIYLGD
ncbi:MAG: Pyrophosphate--fructose 6-phosphate 1-phosphotransferase [Alphaproteobacteria bacterium MarineAlpha5_Bin11]|nr:6-phosphofructokinase [Pelagibacteraceae bacterium]PPR44216.1 MAG: Pyrophosphate--fructose 6-phosphate 1-phosphotransferase [Alphaproteobacteria bacterium MarineAlpha5_Bin11]PPR51655.1 MAG: Pyrophosphate--fructose 6-phosphate 1-phosphotransferase [Alphaproteobacteria bacterium MarineAlpha5_Bin10]|tara:strand:- start:14842 stop:15924 length:1083 start_codon:yes stop_codon:yes gene_type:complete